MNFHIVQPGAKEDLYVCKMMGPDAIGTSFRWNDRTTFKTYNGVQRAYKRLRDNRLIDGTWHIEDQAGRKYKRRF